jgi:rhomboid protease GluP
MNMLSLWFVGRALEPIISKFSYIAIYIISGIIGGLISIYIHSSEMGVGASGAIFGIFGALSGIVIVRRKELGKHFKVFMKDFGIILVLNLAIGLFFNSVDLSAHIGGLVAGMIGGAIVAKKPILISVYIVLSTLFIVLFYNYIYKTLLALYRIMLE